LGSESRFRRAFFETETVEVAQRLLGALLVHATDDGRTSGRIVETEAYRDASDLASHAAIYKTGGVQSMFGPAGIVYVYRSYGIHAMFNIVARGEGSVGAVLIRALEPLEGVELMRARRGVDAERGLCSGPGKLCQAIGIRLTDHGRDLVSDERLWIEPGAPPARIFVSPRIGITRSVEHPWRFFDPDSRFVSAHRRGDPVEPEPRAR
jgi:DNA-3-methyladenine glycosylase